MNKQNNMIYWIGIIFGVLIIMGIAMYSNKVSEYESILKTRDLEILSLKNETETKQNELSDLQSKYDKVVSEKEQLDSDLIDASDRIVELDSKLISTSEYCIELEEENAYLTEKSKYIYNNEWSYDYTEEDLEILAGVLYGENYTTGRWEMMLTGSVVLNRVLSPNFPNTIKDVVYQFDGGYEQYAPRTKRLIGSDEAKKFTECYELASLLLEYGPVAPGFLVYQAHFNQGTVYWEWEGEEFCYHESDKVYWEEERLINSED